MNGFLAGQESTCVFVSSGVVDEMRIMSGDRLPPGAEMSITNVRPYYADAGLNVSKFWARGAWSTNEVRTVLLDHWSGPQD